MDSSIWTAIMALVGTALGTIGSARLTAYRIQQLEKKVEKHNCLIERMVAVEARAASNSHRIDDIEKEI